MNVTKSKSVSMKGSCMEPIVSNSTVGTNQQDFTETVSQQIQPLTWEVCKMGTLKNKMALHLKKERDSNSSLSVFFVQ